MKKYLIYRSQAAVVELTPTTALVGHDGWADGRLGDLESSDVIFNDFLLIDELNHWLNYYTLDKPASPGTGSLGDEAAGHLKSVLAQAAGRYFNPIVATHIPPFREAAWYPVDCPPKRRDNGRFPGRSS